MTACTLSADTAEKIQGTEHRAQGTAYRPRAQSTGTAYRRSVLCALCAVPFPAAILVSSLVAVAAFRGRALTGGGAALAVVVGFLVLAGTGWPGGLALGAFFVSSTMVSRRAEEHEPVWLDAPGNRRNPWQVAANGGVAAAGGLLGLLGQPALGLAVVACALAAAAADTWATSWGMSAPGDPIDIWRRTRVPKGTSGAISLRGTLGGLSGGALVAAAPLLAGAPLSLFAIAAGTGAVGMLADSLLGATIQGGFYCPVCELPSERPVHRCGARTRLVRGRAWLGNDAVNLLATALAGLGGAAWWAAR